MSYGCVLYEWLGWQDSVWSGSLFAPTPHALGCYVHSIALLRTAPSSTVPGGSPLPACAGPHPACCTGIGYRRSSSTRSRRSASTMLIQRMPRNAVAHLDTLADFALLALHSIHCTAQCSRCARGYRCCSPLTHSFRCHRSTLPCLRCTAHRHRQSTKSPQN